MPSNAENAESITALNKRFNALTESLRASEDLVSSLNEEIRSLDKRLSDLEGRSSRVRQSHDRLDSLIVELLADVDPIKLNGFTISENLEEDNKAVNSRLRILVRNGNVTRHQTEGKHPTFSFCREL